MSRAEYLSKYLSTDKHDTIKEKKKKKKKKKEGELEDKKRSKHPGVQEDEAKRTLNIKIDDTRLIDTFGDESSDAEEPVFVEAGTKPIRNMGFKRIDDGTEPKNLEKPKDNQNNAVLQSTRQQSQIHNTVYRDSTGRIIDIENTRRILSQQKEDEKQKAKEDAWKLKTGDVQKLQEIELQQALKNTNSFSVTPLHKEYVDYMKAKPRLEDPLLEYGASANQESRTDAFFSVTGRPFYQNGVSPPNRFGIKAGYFWDGIDRSNGFEQLTLRQKNETDYAKKSTLDTYDLDLEL